ncbi:MFS multidrug transporter-like protein [Coleophoma cylindrospora]|uniref:MFS multidrug transporter-like protein n=1 Tax=Coleophoma cylindrospora TaxID=1849047 RepID=A0A3D8S8G7_9HELO|nr:MFS multidrug transporter-like protein [Coleophoma cylindrospora]
MSSPPRTTDTYDHARIEDDEHTESTPILPASVSSKSYAGGQPDGKSPRALGEPPLESRTPSPAEASDAQRRLSFVEEDEDPLQIEIPPDPALPAKEKNDDVTWMSLPHKRQLLILTCARLSEPLVQTSLRSYLWYMLKSFDHSLPDSTIASQAGIMQGAFAAAQLCTAMLWGRFSDSHGRKKALLLGLTGTTISCLGFGFSTTFWQALVFRMIGGATNGNIGVMRTMISEIVREKKYQSRAFLLLPMCANAGTIIGPVLGGIMSDPAGNYPKWFGGISWLERFPYSPPNLLSAIFLGCAACAVIFGLDETHDIHGQKEDWGRNLGHRIASLSRRLRGHKPEQDYTALEQDERRESHESADVELSPAVVVKKPKAPKRRYKNQLPFRRIFTFNVMCTLLTHALFAFSQGTYNSIFFTFLSTPVYDPSQHGDYTPHPPLVFTGGLGLPASSVGFSMAILGTLGITLQLFLYPIINARLGTVGAWRVFLYLFPVVYILTPFLALVPSTRAPPEPKTGPMIWVLLTGLIFVQVIARTFATPAAAILINNCSPHPSVLGTIHGMGTTASSAARTIGPALGGYVYGVGMDNGVIGATFWALAGMAVLTVLASNFVKDGDGHEIWLEGDEEPEESGPSETRR